MYYITVEEMRRYLNIPFSNDDLLLMELIEGSQAAIENYIEQPLSVWVENGNLNAALKTAIKTMCANMYINREPVAYGTPYKVPYTLEFLLQPFKKYTRE